VERCPQGLKIKALLDVKRYQTAIKVTYPEIKAIAFERNSFHGEWNYVIKQQTPG